MLRIDSKEAISDVIWDTAEKLIHRATLLENVSDSARLLRAPSHKSINKLKVNIVFIQPKWIHIQARTEHTPE